jgi:adenosylcobyric acid synthase
VVARVVKRRARAVMVLGTGSSVGKSAMVAALCRHLARNGVRVAPFKAQNMSLNSAATPEGLEIGRAQALQAEAAGIAPSVDHNPILIKPTSETGAQIIVNGRIWGRLDASDYGGTTKRRFWPFVVDAYERLAAAYDAIVIEGAGSPAEINLRAGDIVNMAVAHMADARCVLVGDIDRGGVFASIFGTLGLLDEADRARIDGWIVNKFRGSRELLQPGIEMLEERIGKPCYGVVPHLGDLGLDEEDGVSLEDPRRAARGWRAAAEQRLRVAVIRLPHLANFTDFDALYEEPSVDLRYVANVAELQDADVVILPGSKDTIADLAWLGEHGLGEPIAAAARERIVVGICAGMQLLGRRIDDRLEVESGGSHAGLGILNLTTTLAAEKVTVPVRGRFESSALCATTADAIEFGGYEIHTGVSEYGAGLAPFAAIVRNGDSEPIRDGAIARQGRVLATYVHGIFANDAFRHTFVRAARERAGLPPPQTLLRLEADRTRRLDRLADAVANAVDLETLFPELRVAAAR